MTDAQIAPDIRPFHRKDQDAARTLVEAGLGEHFGFIDPHANPDLVDIDASYLAKGHAFFIAELAGIIVGTTGLLVAPPKARLVRVSVANSSRRLGIATRLLNHVERYAHNQGLATLIAYTQPEWPDACGFYLQHGFSIYGRDSVDIHLRRPVSGFLNQSALHRKS